MADRLLVLLATVDTSTPEKLVAPLFQATVAVAMEYDVEVVFTGVSRSFLRPGVSDRLVADETSGRTVYALIRAAHQAGVVFKACGSESASILIDEIEERVTDAYVISRVMAGDTETLTY